MPRRDQLLGGSARHVKHAESEHFLSGPDVLPEQTYPPDFNHTYGILDLVIGTISYYQTPSWEDAAPSSVVDRSNIVKPKVNPLISYSIT